VGGRLHTARRCLEGADELLELPLRLLAAASILLYGSLQALELLERSTIVERSSRAILTLHHV
jgi:hypothetical protein